MNKHIAQKAHSNALVGCRVRVHHSDRYGQQLTDHTGVIRVVWSADSIGVDIDFLVNEGSRYGYFYFNTSELEVISNENKIEEGDTTMNTNLTNYKNVVDVQIIGDTGSRIFECANYDEILRPNDLCVIQTKRHGMALARVVHVKDHPDRDLYREVVTGIDTHEYDARVEQRKKALDLKAKMQERAKQLQDVMLYQALAKEDPEMAALLHEYVETERMVSREN